MVNPRKGIQNAFSNKKTADERWNEIYRLLMTGEKVDHGIIGRCMMECNNADALLLSLGVSRKEIMEKG